jgi:hypothetical protein
VTLEIIAKLTEAVWYNPSSTGTSPIRVEILGAYGPDDPVMALAAKDFSDSGWRLTWTSTVDATRGSRTQVTATPLR